MATKLQFYGAVAERTVKELTNRRGNWMHFLETAARLYKYPFPDQMMIFAQRPDAIACAPIELWNDSFDRWVRRGSKGIALIDDTGSYPRLKYVFDVADTEPSRYNARPVRLWEMRQEHRESVLAELAKSYDDVGETLSESFHNIALQLATEYYDDNARDIHYRAEDSFLEARTVYDFAGSPIEDADDGTLKTAFVDALSKSIAYSLMSRCGFDTSEHFDDEDFGVITEFNTPDMVYALGTATSELSAQVLRDIEIVIKKYERLHAAERSEQNYDRNPYLHSGRGLSASRSGAERAGTEPSVADGAIRGAGEIREDAESVSERTQDNQLQSDVADREIISPSSGSRTGSDGAARTDDESVDGANDPARQGERPDGLDGGNEHLARPSGGNGSPRTDLQLEEQAGAAEVAAPFSMADTFSQVGKSSILGILSTSPITLDEVDAILRDGGNLDDHRLNVAPFHSRSALRIAARFAKGLDDNADFLKREYLTGRYGRRFTESGKGFDFGNHQAGARFQVSTWFTAEGIELATGNTAQKNVRKMLIPWEDAAARIDELMREGRYIPRGAFGSALDNERSELADRLWFFYRDNMGNIPDDFNADTGGHPADHELIKSLLEDDNERQRISKRLKTDVETWKNDPELHTWRASVNSNRLLEEMNALMHPPVIYPTADKVDTKAFTYFITQDEIDSLLTHGGHFSEGKMRFLSFFLHDHDTKEKIEFVKREYGHGGGTWGQTNGWHDAEPGKGVTLKRGTLGSPEAEVNLKWPAVIKRTEQLIGSGQYMTREELDNIPSYERLMLARKLNNFYYTLPEEYERPFPGTSKGIYPNEYTDENGERTLNFHYPYEAEWQAIRDLLDNPERVENLLARMQYIFDNTPEEDRHYDYKKAGIEALTAYRNGTYTLFPGLDNLPEPGAIQPRIHRESVIDLSERGFGEIPQATEQMTLFGIMEPQLPSVNEQIAKIDQSMQQEAADADAPFLNISEADKARIAAQFSQNPRSREAANLVREVYGDSLGISLPQAIKRITDLVENGAFSLRHDPYTLFDRVRDELSERGFAVSGELIEDALNEYNAVGGKGDFQDVADFIENEYLTEEEPEYEPVNHESSSDTQSETSTSVVPEAAQASEPVATEPIELDFDTVAQTVLERVMADTEFAAALSEAQGRGALRRPLNTALEIAVYEHQEDEPQVYHAYNNDDDFNDRLFDFVYRQAWERRPQAQAVITPEVETPKSETQHADSPNTTVADAPVQTSPPPVFFVDWEKAQHDFDLNLYQDHDVIGYNKDGVKTELGRSGNFTYITTTGAFWGGNEVPGDIYDQLQAYKNGEITDEQVRENYLKVLADFKKQPTAEIAEDSENLADEQQQTPPPSPQQRTAATNFRITDDHLGEGGAKTKFRYNIEAIKTLQAIEFEKRIATSEEQQTLSRYVGWGGIQQAFDPNNKQWENEYLELNMLLSPEEWESARATVLNAHYTSPTVIKAIYEAVERMGFTTGNILEPACGVGNFFGLLPESMKAAKLYGVELDSITARIAGQLYPKANIKETGFEKTDMPDSFFDIAIGNVPFGDYGIADKRYDKHHFKVHDYFFGKTLDQVRPGGIIAFITSKGTLDKKNPEVRKYIAQRAELLGAVRLPNTAFLKNAGTEVTSDILFLQKRDRPLDIEPDWVHLGMTEDGIPVNRYFLDNPEMMLGKMTNDSGTRMYGNENSTTCEPFEGADLAEQLKTALSYIQGEFTVPELDDLDGVDNHAIPADTHVKNFSYALITPATEPHETDGQIYAAKIGEGQVYFRENSLMYPVDLPATTLERIKGMIALRDCVHRLIQLQLDDHDEAEISAQQRELNDLYDSFIAEFGLINSTANNRAFNADSAYYLLSSLEILDEEGNLARKADMFTKRTIKQKTVITHVDTASEALAVSLGERAHVDLDYMSDLTGFSVDRLISDLQGVIFCDVGNPNRSLPPFDPDKMKIYEKYPFVTAGEYLSGNVREKLAKAKQFQEVCGDSFHGVDVVGNVTALEAVMPKDLDASEIAVRLGSTWIDPEYVQQFMYELLNTSYRNQQLYKVNYFPYTGLWQVSGKGRAQYSDVSATATYGTTRMNAYEIIDDTLNLRDVRVYDYKEDADGKQVRVLNKKETMLAQQRQDLVKQAFKDWIWKDPERRQTLVQLYNERFNSVRPREYDGSHIQFVGANPEITFLKHQEDAVARQMYGGNTLLAHVVGAGKTFEMVAAAMEMKRLGLCQKSLFAVPNHLTEQWAAEFLRLYPNANILVAKKKDFEMRNRKKFCAKIATGEYDAVIIGHTQLEKIPMSRERQERLLNDQLYEIEAGIAELKESNGEKFTIKQLEKTKKSIEARLVKLLEAKQRDDVVTFEQLGADRLFVDEAHGFKNLFLYTKMRNVAGLSTSEAQKSSDLFMKCRYMDELTGNKGTIFATGTPISNSMTEMYTMQRYLQYDKLMAKNLIHFDCWASIFGETVTSIELAPEGTGYRARTRFAKFHNLPELMCMFKEVADIQTADMLNLPVPDAKYETIVVEPSEFQKEMVQELSERAAAVHAKLVDPRDDNMLKITTDGRKIGLDQRLYNPLLSDFEGSKVNACTENVFGIWNDTRADRLTQLVFCDFSTPNKDGRFNIYDDIKAKLLERGIPEHEIAFIHDADTETRKKELFAKVRQGKVRILFGSTFKMGAGTNVQDKLIAIHDADCPWRPADLEQRAGRIVRQGNQNAEVKIFRYATNGTFDSYLWQTVENKQKFISQIMTSKSPVRSCEDVDEAALSYAEIKALCAGNPLIAEKMNLDIEVAKLRMLKSEHQSLHFRLEDDLLKNFPRQIASVTERIEGIEKDIASYAVHKEKCVDVQHDLTGGASVSSHFPGMTVCGVNYGEKEPAAKALLESCKGVTDKSDKPIGDYMGFKMSVQFDSFSKQFRLLLRGNMTYQIELGTDTFGNITRINNALDGLPKRLEGAKEQLEGLRKQVEAAKQELAKPFSLETELTEKSARLALLNADLNIDGGGDMDVVNDPDERDSADESDYDFEPVEESGYAHDRVPQAASFKSTKPSILDGIRSFDGSKQQSVYGRDKPAERDI